MKQNDIITQIHQKKSFLCIGLDVDLDKIPKHLKNEKETIYHFNKQIIDATHDLAIAYKLNTAFYEAYGLEGWIALEKTIDYLNKNYPEIFTIADAKRGDIGNTSTRYAKAFFEQMDFDAITVAPYMGRDSVEPFLAFDNKFTILLALTSNKSSSDFQMISSGDKRVYESVIEQSLTYKHAEQLMFVVGATKPEYFKSIRDIAPHHFLLVPGVGAQGGSLKEVCTYGLNNDVGLIINSSRGIIYAGNDKNFRSDARHQAQKLQQEMHTILDQKFK